ncbi:zinc finger protein 830 [Lucilia sericata]|uniref:zinc finger protein 830 n=1 Tax=Lucilia sericata TaxID=13632 RepID=UPI0018A7F1BB|nr:zinc finger protein 830 [Lucilia sericata]
MCKQVLDKPLEKKQSRKKESNTPLHLKKLPEDTVTTNKKEILISKLSTTVLIESSDLLPELFFDDPIVDAKVRNVEYKNGQDDEWEKFQREIKEESMTSNKLISGEQINAAVEREITEISEQIYQWSKVIDLENKLNKINKKEKRKIELGDSDEDSSENEFINESLDWRTKKIW